MTNCDNDDDDDDDDDDYNNIIHCRNEYFSIVLSIVL